MKMSSLGQHMSDIKDPQLGQALVLAPGVSHEAVAQALATIQLTPDAPSSGMDNTPGAVPLTTSYAFEGKSPRVIFSSNPIVDLLVLDVSLCPPALRRRIHDQLPVVDRATVEAWAQDSDERIALRGFWAAAETERVDLLRLILTRQNDANPLIAAEAARAAERLDRIDTARMTVIGAMGMIAQAAVAITQTLANPKQMQGFLASRNDFDALFTPEVAAKIVQSPAEQFTDPLSFPIVPASDEKSVFAAVAGLFRDYAMPTRPFPLAYHDAAPWLLPGVIWVGWRGDDLRHGKITYDGLAFTGSKWVFCPRPYRLVFDALPPQAAALVLP
ncbi:MAG: hypothetical protein AAGF56_02220 [Pseudomonadota bacterium]